MFEFVWLRIIGKKDEKYKNKPYQHINFITDFVLTKSCLARNNGGAARQEITRNPQRQQTIYR